MKNKIILLLIVTLCLPHFSAEAKEKKLKSLDTKISLDSKKERDPLDPSEIEPFNFDKLFNEAEKYYKASKAWKKLKCQPKSGFLCTKHECVRRDTKIFLILDKEESKISRCEGDNCETFDGEFKQTGVFYNVQTEGPIGTLIRILGDNRYKEISTVGLDAYIANGNCEVILDEEEQEKEDDK